jgi:hypothetical protein
LEIQDRGPSAPEKLITLRKAAEEVGAHYWQILRAVNGGGLRSYKPFNSRKLVKLSEVVAFIEASRQGGTR